VVLLLLWDLKAGNVCPAKCVITETTCELKETLKMKRTLRTAVAVSTVVIVISAIMLSSAPAQRSFRSRGDGRSGSELEKPPVARDENEKKILGILSDILATQRYRNVPPQDGRFLRITAESMNAKNVVEIGTSTGYSGIWFGMALQKTGGKLTTFEIDAGRAATARANFKRAGMADIITVVEGDAHEKVKKLKEKIDILFLDADKEGYIDYLNKLLPLLRPGGLVIAHNINPRMADPKYIEAITTNPDLETIVRSGVGVTLKKR
jgi:predicted O-methyltransferase YrrM